MGVMLPVFSVIPLSRFRRRKSVRVFSLLMRRGDVMRYAPAPTVPKEEVALLDAGDLESSVLPALRRPRQHMQPRARTAPIMRPGKKDATTAVVGKASQWQSAVALLEDDSDAEDVDDEEAPEVDAAVADAIEAAEVCVADLLTDAATELADGDTSCWASLVHNPFEVQLYPKGQHLSAQVCISPLRFVVITPLAGNRSAFCRVTLQEIGPMLVQDEPSGQQRTVVLEARTRHVSPLAQQKSSGIPSPLHCVAPATEQLAAARWARREVVARRRTERRAIMGSTCWLPRTRLFVVGQ